MKRMMPVPAPAVGCLAHGLQVVGLVEDYQVHQWDRVRGHRALVVLVVGYLDPVQAGDLAKTMKTTMTTTRHRPVPAVKLGHALALQELDDLAQAYRAHQPDRVRGRRASAVLAVGCPDPVQGDDPVKTMKTTMTTTRRQPVQVDQVDYLGVARVQDVPAADCLALQVQGAPVAVYQEGRVRAVPEDYQAVPQDRELMKRMRI
jgi:hypothetical protein